MSFDFFGLGLPTKLYDFNNKKKAINSYIRYMMNRVQSMFKYDGLPDTIPQKMIEMYIMTNGHAVIIEHEGKLYVCFGGWGGEPNEYYIPQEYIVANPYLELFKTYKIGVDCVLAYNDSLYYGLMPMFNRYASLMAENDISLRMSVINSRIVTLISAGNDNTKLAADEYLRKIENGEMGVIGNSVFWEQLKAQPYGETALRGRITELIEYQQYLKASWFNEIGLNANYNMKREAINSDESQLNDDMLLPLIDDMLNCRKQWVEQVNKMFGTDWSVEFNSSWQDNMLEIELEQELMESQINDSERSEQDETENEKDTNKADIPEDDSEADE